MTTTEALAEEDETEVSTMTTEALAEESEETTRQSERLRRRRCRCFYGLRVFTTRTAASSEKDGPAELATTKEESA